MSAPQKLSAVEAAVARDRRCSVFALVTPLLVVAALGLSTCLGRSGRLPAPLGGDTYTGETIAVTFGAHLAPLCAVMLRNQYQTTMQACAALQKPMSPAERAWAEQGCRNLLKAYNSFAARVPAEVIDGQGLPRRIPVTARMRAVAVP